jgi:hypothetical protein
MLEKENATMVTQPIEKNTANFLAGQMQKKYALWAGICQAMPNGMLYINLSMAIAARKALTRAKQQASS